MCVLERLHVCARTCTRVWVCGSVGVCTCVHADDAHVYACGAHVGAHAGALAGAGSRTC